MRTLRISKQNLVYFILLFPFLMPDIVTRNHVLGIIIQYWKIITGIWTIYKLLISKKITIFPIILSVFYLIVIINSAVRGKIDSSILTGFSLIWMVNYMTIDSCRRLKFYNMYLFIMKILIHLNFISMIVFPNGMYSSTVYSSNWLIGYKNVFVVIMIPVLTIQMLKNYETNRKNLNFWTLSCVCLFSMMMSESTTGLICIIVFILLASLVENNKFPELLNLSRLFGTYIIIDILLVSGWLLSKTSEFITAILNKSITLTGRTAIWNIAVEKILQKPLIGYGFIESNMFGLSFKITHAHSLLLNLLLLGGIICVIVLMTSFIYLDYKNKENRSKSMEFVITAFFSIFIMGLSESLLLNGHFVFAILIIANNILNYEKHKELNL